MTRIYSRTGFSLIEVVVATGILAVSIFTLIGLLAPTLRGTREVLDSFVAARLTENVENELRRFVRAESYEALDAATDDPRNAPLVVYASADGSRVALHGEPSPERRLDRQDRYFVLFIGQLSSPDGGNNLLALNVTVEWPYLRDDDAPSTDATRPSYLFTTSIRRW